MKCCRQVVSFVLVVFMIFSSFIPIFATGTSTVTLTVLRDDDILNVVIPAKLPITIDEDANIIIPSDLAIVNNSNDEAVSVTKIVANVENDWEIVDWNTNLKDEEIGTKKIAMQFRGDNLQTTGEFDLTDENWNIPVNSSLPLDMIAKLPMQEETDEIRLATVSFTLELLDDPSTDDISMLSVDYDNGLMLPGSLNSATFNWETNVEGNTLVDVISDNPDVADVSLIQTFALDDLTEGIQNVSVEAKSRGIATITGRLNTGETASFVVNVSELDATIEPSGVVDNLIQEELEIGDSLTPEDITVNIPIIKPDGTTENITVTPSEVEDVILSEGENEVEVTVDANGETIVIVIVVYVERDVDPSTVVDSISVKTNPNKTEYNIGDNFEKDGLSIEVKYQDNHSITITDGYTIINGESLLENQTFITVEYEDKSCEVPIIVSDWSIIIDSIVVKTNPDKTEYIAEDDFDSTGMIITVNYKDGNSEDIDNGFTVQNGENLVEGQTSVTVEYGGKECIVDIIVSKKEIVYQDLVLTSAYFESAGIDTTADEIIIPETFEHEGNYYRVVGIGTRCFYKVGASKIVLPPTVVSIGKNAFEATKNLYRIDLPSNLTSIGDSAFIDSGLVEITIPFSVISFGNYVFQRCYSLKSVIINGSITELKGTFIDCLELTYVKLPDGLTAITGHAFKGCSSLSSLTIPSTVNNLGTGSTFGNCTSLESIVIPHGVTSLPLQLFYGCSKLSKVVVPSSVTSMGQNVFYNCSSLRTVYFRGSQSKWNSISQDTIVGNGLSSSVSIIYNYTGN